MHYYEPWPNYLYWATRNKANSSLLIGKQTPVVLNDHIWFFINHAYIIGVAQSSFLHTTIYIHVPLNKIM